MFYSACIPALFGGKTAREALAAAKSAGLNHYEFWGWNEEQIASYAQAQAEFGMTPVAMCTTFHELTDPNGREAYVEGIKKTIPVCKKLGCKNIISQVGPERSDISRQAQHQSIVAGLKAAAPYVEEAGLVLVFEPLNIRVDHVGYYLWSEEEAFQIQEEVGSPNVKVLIDLYHQAVMDDLDIGMIVANLDKIGHFHMAGVPGRHEPLIDCKVDYAAVLDAIRKAGYTEAVGLEYFPVHPVEEGLKTLVEQLSTY